MSLPTHYQNLIKTLKTAKEDPDLRQIDCHIAGYLDERSIETSFFGERKRELSNDHLDRLVPDLCAWADSLSIPAEFETFCGFHATAKVDLRQNNVQVDLTPRYVGEVFTREVPVEICSGLQQVLLGHGASYFYFHFHGTQIEEASAFAWIDGQDQDLGSDMTHLMVEAFQEQFMFRYPMADLVMADNVAGEMYLWVDDSLDPSSHPNASRFNKLQQIEVAAGENQQVLWRETCDLKSGEISSETLQFDPELNEDE